MNDIEIIEDTPADNLIAGEDFEPIKHTLEGLFVSVNMCTLWRIVNLC
jgi:hypothetical protein